MPDMTNSVYQDGTYLQHNPQWHEEDSAWKAEHIVELLRRNQVMPTSIAEVGCGGGLVLKDVSERFPGCRAVGYEISPQAFARARQRSGPGLEFLHKDILGTDDSYDLVLVIDVFEHVEDYLGFLRRLRRHATRQVFHIPLDMNVQAVARMSPILHARRQVGHLHYFSKETALATLDHAGYTIKDWFYTYGALDSPGRSRASRLVSFLRRSALAVNEDIAVRFLGGCSMIVLAD